MASEKRKKWRERKNKNSKIARAEFESKKKREREQEIAREMLIARKARELGETVEYIDCSKSPESPALPPVNVSDREKQTFDRSAWRTQHGLDK